MSAIRLSKLDPRIQAILVTSINRCNLAVTVVEAYYPELLDIDELKWNKKFKRKYDLLMQKIRMYSYGLKGIASCKDGVEIMESATYAMMDEILRMYKFYTEALKRIMDKRHYPHTKTLSRVAMAKHLINMCAHCIGYESDQYWNLMHPISTCGLIPCDYSLMYDINDIASERKTTLGFIDRLSHDVITEALNALGLVDITIVDGEADRETMRSIEIASANIYDVISDYDVVRILYEDANLGKDLTWKEAREIRDKRIMEREKEEAKKARKEELKKAKKNIKQKEN